MIADTENGMETARKIGEETDSDSKSGLVLRLELIFDSYRTWVAESTNNSAKKKGPATFKSITLVDIYVATLNIYKNLVFTEHIKTAT